MVFKKIFGGGGGDPGKGKKSDDIDIEDYLNDLSIRDGRIIEQENIIYVKPVDLDADGKGVGLALKELEKHNIVVISIRPLLNKKQLLHDIIKELRDACTEMDGDIGRISEEKILLVPNGMRIVQKAEGA
ncbi:Cell division protein SepF [uncultured archaeon]|nr:Cell division protein SepF [uncultured archaeon]